MKKIKIKSQSKNYTIFIGLKNLDPLTKFLEENNFKKIMLIFDTNTAKFFSSKFFSLKRKFELHSCVIKSGERSKSWETINQIASNLLKKNFDRKTILIAVGGGVVGDVTGFMGFDLSKRNCIFTISNYSFSTSGFICWW